MSNVVHRIHVAQVDLLGRFNPPTYLDARIDVYAFLVVAGSEIGLIDTGVGEHNSYIETRFKPDRAPLVEELAGFGVVPDDVKFVINSHLHFDHCGNNAAFPNAEIFIQEKELEIARTTLHTVRDWFDYEGARINSVRGDLEIAAGITLLSSPGHTPGHQSVLVETPSGNVLVAAQAAYTADEFQRGGDPAVQAHEGFEGPYVESISRLKSVRPVAAYFSHDANDWRHVA